MKKNKQTALDNKIIKKVMLQKEKIKIYSDVNIFVINQSHSKISILIKNYNDNNEQTLLIFSNVKPSKSILKKIRKFIPIFLKLIN